MKVGGQRQFGLRRRQRAPNEVHWIRFPERERRVAAKQQIFCRYDLGGEAEIARLETDGVEIEVAKIVAEMISSVAFRDISRHRNRRPLNLTRESIEFALRQFSVRPDSTRRPGQRPFARRSNLGSYVSGDVSLLSYRLSRRPPPDTRHLSPDTCFASDPCPLRPWRTNS